MSENTDFVDLLHKTALREDAGDAPAKTEINVEVVRWLNRVIPRAAG